MANVTITGLAAVLAANLDDTARVEVDDKNGNTRKATIAQLRTQIGAATLPLTGGQIAFPATQVPSADANTLDDYEEGTWTPSLQFGGAAAGMTYNTQTARYTKVGRLVTVSLQISLTAKGSSTGGASIAGLPFTVGSPHTGAFGYYEGMAGVTSPSAYASAAATAITLSITGATTTSQMTEANFTNGSAFYATISYTV